MFHPLHPWDWDEFTYMKTYKKSNIHVGKYTVRPMDPVGSGTGKPSTECKSTLFLPTFLLATSDFFKIDQFVGKKAAFFEVINRDLSKTLTREDLQ